MFTKPHQKTICSNDPHVHCISAFVNCCMCVKARICKMRKFCHLTRSPMVIWSVRNSTSAKNRLHAEDQRTSHPHVHQRASSKRQEIMLLKKVVLASSWTGNFRTVLIQQTVWHACYQASQSTTGKSTWIQGWSSFMIPWRHRKQIQVQWTETFWEMR